MSPNFGKKPCNKNLINLNEGPNLDNMLKTLRYSTWYQNNPHGILEKSKNFNINGPLGGPLNTSQPGVYDTAVNVGFLPDILPCDQDCLPNDVNTSVVLKSDKNVIDLESKPPPVEIENFSNLVYSDIFNIVVLILLIVALVVLIFCKINNFI